MDLFLEPDKPLLPFVIPTGSQYSYRWDAVMQAFIIKIPQGELIFAQSFLSEKVSDRSVEYFQENDSYDWRTTPWPQISGEAFEVIRFKHIPWRREYIKMYGKHLALPRLTSWHGDPSKSYSYSGIHSTPQPWNKGLLYIKDKIEQTTGFSFNSVLLNWYRSGEDHMSWHADDEPELGNNPVIASVNFGVTRDFVLRRSDDHTQKIVIPLAHGSLLVMAGQLQHYWQHSVPKRKTVQGSRFNLTFRTVV